MTWQNPCTIWPYTYTWSEFKYSMYWLMPYSPYSFWLSLYYQHTPIVVIDFFEMFQSMTFKLTVLVSCFQPRVSNILGSTYTGYKFQTFIRRANLSRKKWDILDIMSTFYMKYQISKFTRRECDLKIEANLPVLDFQIYSDIIF